MALARPLESVGSVEIVCSCPSSSSSTGATETDAGLDSAVFAELLESSFEVIFFDFGLVPDDSVPALHLVEQFVSVKNLKTMS